MNRLSAAVVTVTTITMANPVWAGSDVPERTRSLIILHGVDCSIEYGAVCDEDRAVFDEAIESMPRSATVVIQNHVLDPRDSQSMQPLARDSAEAVRDYFVGAGIAAEQVEIEECSAPPAFVDADEPIAVQLSNALK